MKDIYFAYEERDREKFLYPPLRKDMVIGIGANYEIFHDLYINGEFRYSEISDDKKGRTPTFLLGNKGGFTLGMQYGL